MRTAAEFSTGQRRTRYGPAGTGLFAAAVFLSVALAVAISIRPWVAVCIGALTCWGVAYVYRPIATVNLGTGIFLAALLVLGYGFVNVGFRLGPVPLPLAEVLLLLLLGLVMVGMKPLPTRFMAPLALFVGLVMVRLVVDYPAWGTLAARDATLGVDVLAAVVGFRLVALGQAQSFIRILKRIFFVTLIYGSLFPLRDQLAQLGPTVGLQQEVPLLGSMSGIGVAVGAAFLFFAVFSSGLQRIFLMSWALGVVALLQARGLYLALPLALLVMRFTAVKASRQMFLRSGIAVLVCLIALLSLSPLNLEGRLGGISPSFYVSHVATLFGEEGPSAGTLTHRLAMTQSALNEFGRSPGTIVLGAGLGPDLASGFSSGGNSFVRKPHNDFLEVLVRLGVLGAALFGWLLVALVGPVLGRARRGSPGEGGTMLCSWTLGATTLYFLVAATQPLLAYPYGAVPLFFYLGVGAGLALTPQPPLEADRHRMVQS